MARRETNKRPKGARVVRRTEWWRDMVRVALAVFCLGLGALVVAWALPERMQLEEKEADLRVMLMREQKARKEHAAYATHYRALRNDQSYLESVARDRLDRCRPNERVFRIER